MRAIIITIFGVSLLVATVAILNATRRGDSAAPQEQVLASSVDLATGTLLRAQDVTWRPVNVSEPDEIVRPNVTAAQARPEIVDETSASVYGAVLRHPLAAGAPIRRGDIVKPGDRDFLQVVLSPGQRAVAIPVATGGASTGLLQAGDRVDVVLTQNFKNDPNQDAKNAPITRRSVSETIAQNLRVLAIDAPDSRQNAMANPANGNFGRTVTMEVSPEQAEQINVAAELGKLSVTLRSLSVANNAEPTVTSEDHAITSGSTNGKTSIRPQWAGDVSPALYGAQQPKSAPVKDKPITVLRGGHVEHVREDTVFQSENDK
jgi:pilus assembly protein CpaB